MQKANKAPARGLLCSRRLQAPSPKGQAQNLTRSVARGRSSDSREAWARPPPNLIDPRGGKEATAGTHTHTHGLPRWLSGQEFTCNAGNTALIPGSERPPGEGKGNPLQYYCLGWLYHRDSDYHFTTLPDQFSEDLHNHFVNEKRTNFISIYRYDRKMGG